MKTILTVFALLACLSTNAQASLTLATRGQPAAYTLVIPATASPSQRHAAQELQTWIERIAGARLPIAEDDVPLPDHAVLLGMTRHTEKALGEAMDLAALGDDGFRLVARPPHLLIIGGPARGVLYGVYETLERFGGCRWYATWHSVIPERDALTVPTPLDETQIPAFALREPFWFDMFDGDLAARNKANGHSMRLTERHGGNIRFGAGLFVHTFNLLCPPEEFFDAHPEYFSEIGGRRIREYTQLCLTNPDVLRIVTERLLQRIRQDPTAQLYSVSQNDWYNNCACAPCKALDEREGSPAGSMIAFVNQVAEAVEKEFPHVWIETLAYQYTRKPPQTVRPRHNVVVRLCSIECDFSLPLNQSPFEENKRFVEDIQAWSAKTDKLYIWDYTTNFRTYTAPFPNVLALQDNVRLFRDNRVAGLFKQGAYQGRHACFAELKAWLLAKWLWNPDLPADALLGDFFSGYYGAAAPLAREVFDGLHQFYGTNQPLRIYDDIAKSALSDAFLERASELWSQAEAAVADSPAHAYNVRMAALPILHARFARKTQTEWPITVWVATEPQRHAVPEQLRVLAATLMARFNEAGNIRLAEETERHNNILRHWRALADPPPLPPSRSRARVEDALLIQARRGVWGDTVKDPLAGDGSALRLTNIHYEWCATLPFQRVAFDPGAVYRIRLRARVEREPGREGEAFWAGVYDPAARKSRGEIARKTSEVTDDYTWHDVATWTPEREHYFWVGPGRFDLKGGATSAIRALYIDCVEIFRADAPEP